MKLVETLQPTGVIYSDDDHSYRRESDGELYPSCTKIAGLVPKDYLKKWTTKENYLYVKANWNINRMYTESEKEKLLLTAKDIYEVKSGEAMRIGSEIHNWIENHINGIDNPKPEGREWVIDEFLAWEEKNIDEWMASEFLVASHEHKFAGRLDAVAKFKNGLVSIVDFKTSNSISPEYALQTAGYWIALKEMGANIDQRKILMITKESEKKIYDKVKKRYFDVMAHVECSTIMNDLKEDVDCFLSFRSAYNWIAKYADKS